MRPPAFWDADAPRSSARLTRALLSPLGALYAAATARRIARTIPAPAPAPVICVGNLTLGGTGKTPVAIAVIETARGLGLEPAGLSRGWGGSLKGPLKVDPRRHGAREVGDEPLLIARAAPAYIDAGRVEGARLAAREGADLIVMDDGHQNPKLEKTRSLVVVDAVAGWGAGTVFPAGPLREPVEAGLARADAVIVMGPSREFEPDYARLRLDTLEIPVLKAWLAPEAAPPAGPLLAFAGIGRPQKFFDALAAAGGELADTASFPDHHAYTRAELDQLADLASAHGARLITTEKDWVRLPGGVGTAVAAWPVRARFAEPARLEALIQDAVDAHRRGG
ncbi:MAG: tetraacyldisaccharide 4'-kinase [Oceanicaulis sp.]